MAETKDVTANSSTPAQKKKTALYACPGSRVLSDADKVPLTSGEVLPQASGQASTRVTHDGTVIATPGQTVYQQMTFQMSAPSGEDRLEEHIAAAASKESMKFNSVARDGARYEGFYIVDFVNPTSEDDMVHNVGVTPYNVTRTPQPVTTP